MKIKKLGNYACNYAQAYVVVDSSGIAPCVLEQHGGVTATVVKTNERKQNNSLVINYDKRRNK